MACQTNSHSTISWVVLLNKIKNIDFLLKTCLFVEIGSYLASHKDSFLPKELHGLSNRFRYPFNQSSRRFDSRWHKNIKWAILGLCIIYFRSFQSKITIFATNESEKCPLSIWCQDSNSQPPPLTTRPRLPPNKNRLEQTTENVVTHRYRYCPLRLALVITLLINFCMRLAAVWLACI